MDEEEDAAAHFSSLEQSDDEDDDAMPDWAGSLFTAWQMLRNDRQFFDMGGCSGIRYAAISAYAADHGIAPDHFGEFLTFLRVMDDEYVAFSSERAKEAAERAKSGNS